MTLTRKQKQNKQLRRKMRQRAHAAILAEATDGQNHDIQLVCAAKIIEPVEAEGEGEPQLPRVSIEAYNGGPMPVPGYYRPVVIDLAGAMLAEKPVPLFRSHDADRIVGYGTATREGNSIQVAGVLSGDNEDTREIVSQAKNGFPWQASVGFQPTRLEKVDAGESASINGQVVHGPAVVARAGRLYEVSIVPLGADQTTTTTVAAEHRSNGTMDFSAWLSSKGFVEAELGDAALASLRAMYEAENSGGASSGGGTQSGGAATQTQASVSAQAAINEMRRSEERTRQYSEILARYMNDRSLSADDAEAFLAAAESQQQDPNQLELELLRHTRANGPSGASRASQMESGAVVEAALAMNCTGVDESSYSAETLQRARDAYPNGLTLMEVVAMAARRNGYRGEGYRINPEMMRAAFTPIQARGASTYDLSGVLGNVANKAIMAGFMAVESTWRDVAAIGSVTDFKEITSYALTGDFEYRETKGGELQHATMGEQSYTNQADTYGRLFSISYQDLVNDDLRAFDRARRMIGRGGALKLNKVFWTEFLDSVTTFFTTARGNYFEGASSALGIDSLTTAEQMFMDQTDPDGNPLGVTPAILLTPNSLATVGRQYANDAEIRDTTTSKKYTTSNPHAGKFKAVRSSYLNNANIANGSANHWFLLADPEDMPLIEMVFLNGRQEPIVEAAQADFDTLGVQMRGYHNFGASKQEYRAGVRSKGEA